MRRCGVLYQSGALWSSMTLAENVALPIETYTELKPHQTRELVSLKLALVGWPVTRISIRRDQRGMQKRPPCASHALDPDILFFDEPSQVWIPSAPGVWMSSSWNCVTAWVPPWWW